MAAAGVKAEGKLVLNQPPQLSRAKSAPVVFQLQCCDRMVWTLVVSHISNTGHGSDQF